MARRNIFDRDTGAGYYSDALGNFLENIPSFYGQMAKEKRLEKQRIEDTNYRNQAYNDSLMQQAKTNIRLAESDQLTKDKFAQKVKNDEYTQAYQIAEAYYKATGDYSRLAQVEKQYSPETYDANKSDKIKAGFNIRKDFDDGYKDWDSLTLNDKYARGNELNDLISKSAQLMKTGDSRNKQYYAGVNKILTNELKTYTLNSGKNIKDTDLWAGEGAGLAVDSFEETNRGILSLEKRIESINEHLDEMSPISPDVKMKDGSTQRGWSNFQKRTIANYNEKLKKMDSDKAKLILKKDGIANDFKYPVLNLSPAGEDYALEGMKPERPAEEITNLTDKNQEKLEEIDSNILSSITGGGLPDDEKLDEFLVAMDDSEEALEDYLYGYETDEEVEAPEQIQTNLADVETGDKIEQPVVTETETEDKIDVSDTIGKTVDEDIDVVEDVADAVDTVDEVPEPDQGAVNILSELLPLVSAADDKPSLIETKPIDDLFSTDPSVVLTEKQKEIVDKQKKHYEKFDKNFEKNAKVAQEIYESGIKDAKGQNINMLNLKDFNKQINSMANRVKEINKSIKVQLPNQPETYLSYKQDVVEQKQLVNDLMLLKEKLDNVTKLYIPDLDTQGRKTGKLHKKGFEGYKQSLKKVIDSLPKYYDLKSHKYDISQSEYENILGY